MYKISYGSELNEIPAKVSLAYSILSQSQNYSTELSELSYGIVKQYLSEQQGEENE